MASCREIAQYLERLAPLHLAESWDNVGLLVGDMGKSVEKVLLALDMDEYVASEASRLEADMIITHHPIMFSPINRVTEDDPMQRTIRILIKNDICHYAAHTNFDIAPGGLNDFMAKKIGLKNTSVLDVTADGEYGFGRYADLDSEVTLREMLEKCKNAFDIEGIKYIGDLDEKIKRVAVNSGGGSSSIGKCYEKGVDLFITGDIKYSVARDAYERGLCVIDAGHYDTEVYAVDIFCDYLSERFADVEFIKSQSNVKVVKTYI